MKYNKKNNGPVKETLRQDGRSALPVDKTEKKQYTALIKPASVVIAFAFVLLIYIASLINIVANYERPDSTATEKTSTKTVTLQAVRGEIFDCNGKALVSNVYEYSLRLEYGLMSTGTEAQNRDLSALISFMSERGLLDKIEFTYCPLSGIYPEITYDSEVLASSTARSKLNRILSENSLETDASATDLALKLAEKYGLLDDSKISAYDDTTLTYLILLRYEMDAVQFAPSEPLVLLTDIGMDVVTGIEEYSIAGTAIGVSYSRIYNYPGYASHILGRVSKIYAEDVEKYTSMGYPINALVGVEGCELAFEEYLRGIDGEMVISYDSDGHIISEEVTKEPVCGKDVYLTIDIDIQIAAEEALERNIAYVNEQAEKTAGNFDGEDCDAGALVVENVNTGAIIALASYPSYDLTTFSQNYNSLLADTRKPLLNRALDGTYAPGSTFKVGMAGAALMSGTKMADGSTFTATTIIETKSQYTYYDDYQPKCWSYNFGYSHGKINVTKAIEVSCNCFFYELGRCMGIDTINHYASAYGFGIKTGIELPESKGVLADRAYAESVGDAWSGAKTIQTAIGQGLNLFTPIQLSGYLSTIVNGGKRYSTHILDHVDEFGGETVYTYEPKVASKLDISESIHSVLINAMSRVVDENKSVTAFDNFAVKVGGKTGSAEVNVGTQSKNGVFIGFAPLDNPEIAVSCVLEKGSAGANAAFAVRWVMDEYFSEK